MNKQINGNDKT